MIIIVQKNNIFSRGKGPFILNRELPSYFQFLSHLALLLVLERDISKQNVKVLLNNSCFLNFIDQCPDHSCTT